MNDNKTAARKTTRDIVKVTMFMEVDSVESVKDMTHHMDYYLDFSHNPHIHGVYGVTVNQM